MRKRVSTAPWWIHRDDMNDGGMWAFMHNRKRYVAPAGLLDPPKNSNDPKPTREAKRWHAAMMRDLEPGWPHSTMVVQVVHLSERAMAILNRLTGSRRGLRSAMLRLAVKRLLFSRQDIAEPLGPSAVELAFRIDPIDAKRFSAFCSRRRVSQFRAIDYAVQRLARYR